MYIYTGELNMRNGLKKSDSADRDGPDGLPVRRCVRCAATVEGGANGMRRHAKVCVGKPGVKRKVRQ